MFEKQKNTVCLLKKNQLINSESLRYLCAGSNSSLEKFEWGSFAQNSFARKILECLVFYLPYM